MSFFAPRVPTVDVDALEEARTAGAPVVDVREPDEYEAGHVPGAVLIPLAQVPERVGEVPAAGPVYVICETGGRSERAAQFLRAQGIDAHNVSGGTRAWIRSGRTAATGTEPG